MMRTTSHSNRTFPLKSFSGLPCLVVVLCQIQGVAIVGPGAELHLAVVLAPRVSLGLSVRALDLDMKRNLASKCCPEPK